MPPESPALPPQGVITLVRQVSMDSLRFPAAKTGVVQPKNTSWHASLANAAAES